MLFYPLFSGSSGNASLVEAGGVRILIDAGVTGSALTRALGGIGVEPKSVDALLITHEHSDHVSGAGVFSRKYDVPVYANRGTWEGMLPCVGRIEPRNVRVFETNRDFYIQGVNVTPFKTPHDARESVGYRIDCGGKRLCVMTDIGVVEPRLLDAAEGADLLLIEANHDVDMLRMGRYPYVLKRRILSDVGHLSNESAGKALAKLYLRGLRRAILGHLSLDNNIEELALATVREMLRAESISDAAFELTVAHRDRLTGCYEVG
ncbi:MAG: MBL fold metallo-hydrolase [Clostridiaceae bacterium]|nr:MBL fold metallo-hydrolase [Eubacteriales bacterium]